MRAHHVRAIQANTIIRLRFVAGKECSRGPQAVFFSEYPLALEKILLAECVTDLGQSNFFHPLD
jgi:hypothetical protein